MSISSTNLNKANDAAIEVVYSDGGRSTYFKGAHQPGDCVIRAISIASSMDYKTVYNDIFALNKEKSKGRCKVAKGLKRNGCSPRNGVSRTVYHEYILSLGFQWVACMGIGTGATVHLRENELPDGHLILRLSKHLAAVKRRVLYDVYDCSRGGSRCVYGYYKLIKS